ncbi:DUF4871 domain-containing protein [Peribacillus sp. SCS-37]|uniref:DUF4871 domain-containing protein n=1 Tax=Paraperibacillus esterisolvens TaxID=3115296 RepID=UPI003905E094
MKIKTIFIALLIGLFVINGCESSKVQKTQNTANINLPKDIPSSVTEEDFERIDWTRTSIEYNTGERNDMAGNKNKLGIIGPEAKTNEVQKWMWHLWGVEKAELSIVGFNKETKTVHQILFDRDTDNWYWTGKVKAMGAVNGADAHMLSNVKVPEPGKWAFLVYTDDKLFDILVMDIQDK